MRTNFTLLLASFILFFPSMMQAQFGCAGNAEGSVIVELISVSAPNQGQDNTLQAFYEYTFNFSLRDNLGNNASANCWIWEPPDNQANTVTPGNNSTTAFSFVQTYSGCTQYGQNADLPTTIQAGFRGWEDDCLTGDICDFDDGVFGCAGAPDDDYEECNFNITYNLVNLFAAGTCNGGSASEVVNYACGQYSAQYRITVNLPVFDPAISGAPSAVYCSNDGNINLTAATPGGTWSGMGVDPVSGVFDPESVPTGNHDITYTGVNGCVIQSDMVTISVVNPDASFTNPPATLCMDDAPVSLNPVETPGTWIVVRDDGIMGGINSNNQFSPALNGPGVYTISYTVGNSGVGCEETLVASNTLTVFPVPAFDVDAPSLPVSCTEQTIAAVVLTASSGTYTYSWSGPGIEGPNDGMSININGTGFMAGVYDYTLDVTDSNGCTANQVAFQLTFDCALPIELLDFTAETMEAGIDLYWATATEINNEGFYIERSLDGEDFEVLEFMEGAGNSTNRVEYSFLDENVISGTLYYYYRLQQLDYDGRTQYSEVIAVKTTGKPMDVITLGEVYPNPVKDRLRIDLHTLKSTKVKTRIYDNMGKLVMRDKQRINAGAAQLEIDIAHLPKGVYYLNIEIHQQAFSRKVVKVSH